VEGIEECLKGCGEKDGIDTTALEKAAINVRGGGGIAALYN